MRIYKEQAGVISEGEVWVCMCDCFMYTADTLEELVDVLNTKWRHESQIVG